VSENSCGSIFNTAKEHFKRYRLRYFILTVIFIFGMFIGWSMPERLDTENGSELSSYISDILQNIPAAQIDGKLEMTRAVYLNGISLLIIWFLGFTIIASPIVAAILLYKGFCLGMAVSFLLTANDVQGIIMILLAVLPQNIFLIPIFVIASMLAINFSVALLKNEQGMRRHLLKKFFRYSCCFAILFIAVVLSGYIQGYFDPWLLRMFFKII